MLSVLTSLSGCKVGFEFMKEFHFNALIQIAEQQQIITIFAIHSIKNILAIQSTNLILYSSSIIGYLQEVLNPTLNPSKKLMKDVLGLIGDLQQIIDLASCIGPRIKDQLRTPFIEKLVMYIQNEPDQESKQIADWTLEQIKTAFSQLG